MRIVDVDAHLHEPLDWVEQTNPVLAKELGPPARFMEVADAVFSNPDPVFAAALPERQRPTGRYDLVPPGFVRHLQITDDRQPPLDGEGEAPMYSAEGRLAFCDERGIDVQFLNPTFLVGPFIQAARAGRPDLFGDIRRTWNTWATDNVAGHTDRLIPVTQIDLGDLDGSIAEMERMRNRGSRAFAIPEAPVGTGLRGFASGAATSIGKSITHPDFEPLWSAAEDLGMAAFAHVGFARERINPGWANNGAADMKTFALLNMLVGSQLGPQLLLGAMIYDGVFERHPKLTVVVEEVGIDWLPHLVHTLELSVGRNAPVLEDGEYRPSHLVMGETYDLPLAPVDYLVRQVRVTPLPASHPIHPVIDVVPHELLCFSSDFPHVEGSSSAVDLLEKQLAGASDKVKRDFFGGVGELIGV
jgi:predicted TIM-barrel fold metal-dependent hydrolase